MTEPGGAVISYSYDAASELTGISYSDGTTPSVSFGYDADGQRVSMNDGTGNTSYDYDADDRLADVTDGAGSTVSYGYDPAGRLTSLTYPNGHTVTRGYNGAGWLASVTDWLGHKTAFSYDSSGNLTTESYPNGVRALFSYDNANRITSITDKTGAATLATFGYTRDPQGQVTAAAESGAVNGTSDYGYTGLNQLGSANGAAYGYDTADNLVKLPNGTTQSFNVADELTSATLPPVTTPAATDQVSSASHKANGTTITSPALTTKSGNELLLAFVSATGASGQTQKVTKVKGAGLTWSLVSRSDKQPGAAEIWQAHASGKLTNTKITATLAHAGHGSITITTFTGATAKAAAHAAASGQSKHPVASILSTAPDSLVWAVGEDASKAASRTPAAGQVVVRKVLDSGAHATYWVQRAGVVTAAKTTVKISATTTTSDRWNLAAVEIRAAVASSTTVSYGYDARGNLVKIANSGKAATRLGYDESNRLTSYGTASYAYNGDGLRMSKTVGSVTTQFAWDQSASVPLPISAGSANYVYGPAGQPIEQIQSGTVTYLQPDQQGSTRLLTSSSGAVVGTYTYNPYGATVGHSGTVATALQYDGQYTDAESGLVYLRARYYDPATGQFLGVDQMVSQTRVPFGYAGDNPVNAGDPTGMWSWNPVDDVQEAGQDAWQVTTSAASDAWNGATSVASATWSGVTTVASDTWSTIQEHPVIAGTAGVILGGIAFATGVGELAGAAVVIGDLTLDSGALGAISLGTGAVSTLLDVAGCTAPGDTTLACTGLALNATSSLFAGGGELAEALGGSELLSQLLGSQAISFGGVGLAADVTELIRDLLKEEGPCSTQ